MKSFSRDLLGSQLKITIYSDTIDETIIDECFLNAEKFENKYSRFIDGNYLDKLNKTKVSQIDNEFLSIINLSNKISELSDGFFDITVNPFLENIGYGKEKETQKTTYGYKNIKITGGEIYLENNVSIDLGSVGKGYLIDKIYNLLDKNYSSFVINFGGDIKVKGRHTITLEDPLNDNNSIGEIELENSSIASSTPFKRKTKSGHHLINIKDSKSQDDKIVVFVLHKLSAFSDILSTALFVCPFEKSIELISKTQVEALVISKSGEIFKSSGFNANLNFKDIG